MKLSIGPASVFSSVQIATGPETSGRSRQLASTRGAHEQEPGCMLRSRCRRLAGRPVLAAPRRPKSPTEESERYVASPTRKLPSRWLSGEVIRVSYGRLVPFRADQPVDRRPQIDRALRMPFARVFERGGAGSALQSRA